MADAVTTQVLQDGERQYIAKFTNISDGTGESKVTKIDVSTLNPNSFGLACNGLKITKVVCQTYDMGVDLFWVGDPSPAGDALIASFPQGELYDIPYVPYLPYNASGIKGVDAAGDIALSTRNASNGDTYTIIIHAIKEYHRPADVSGLVSYNVRVAAGTNSYGTGNVFYVDDAVSPHFTFEANRSYRFLQSDNTNNNHPLRFSTTPNGTHAGGIEYTDGVTINNTAGTAGAFTQIDTTDSTPELYYYCSNHSGMGDA